MLQGCMHGRFFGGGHSGEGPSPAPNPHPPHTLALSRSPADSDSSSAPSAAKSNCAIPHLRAPGWQVCGGELGAHEPRCGVCIAAHPRTQVSGLAALHTPGPRCGGLQRCTPPDPGVGACSAAHPRTPVWGLAASKRMSTAEAQSL
eukprot:358064-Chlamydomonas_euryale.AAC.3